MSDLKALVFDFGGVLTTPVWESFAAFSREEGIDEDTVKRLFREDPAALVDLRGLETGKLAEAEFEQRFARRLGIAQAEGLIDRLFKGMRPLEPMLAAVRAARGAGLRTGLLSNSWSVSHYDRELLDELFDAAVISGEVGLHKPQPEIYLMVAERLGMPPSQCVFIDDLRENCEGAEAVGMTAVLHREPAETIARLEELTSVALGPRRVGSYAYDQAWHDERERLAGMERLWDDGTYALFERLGVETGSRVAEVGAGGGSVVEWLAERVGQEGSVLAADVYMKFLEPLAGGAVQVSEHDIRAAPLPADEYDVVHARLLVEHVGFGALGNMLAGVRPGGWLVVEDYDMGCRGWHPDAPGSERVYDAVLDVMAAAGFDRECGRKLPLELDALGLEDVRCEGRAHVVRGGTPETAFSELSLRAMRDAIVSSGRATEEEVETMLERIADPARTWLSPLLVACWGRKAS